MYNIPPETDGLVTPVIFPYIVESFLLANKSDVGNEKRVQYYDKKAVGRRIKQLRKSKGLTQHGLAGLLDYTGSRQLQRIETGETSCTVEKLMEIA